MQALYPRLDCKFPEGSECAFQSWGLELGLRESWWESYRMDLSQHQQACSQLQTLETWASARNPEANSQFLFSLRKPYLLPSASFSAQQL